jgi:hypothetical protein
LSRLFAFGKISITICKNAAKWRKYMPLFKPEEGERYKKEKVLSLCLKYIHWSEFQGNITEKEQKLISSKINLVSS